MRLESSDAKRWNTLFSKPKSYAFWQWTGVLTQQIWRDLSHSPPKEQQIITTNLGYRSRSVTRLNSAVRWWLDKIALLQGSLGQLWKEDGGDTRDDVFKLHFGGYEWVHIWMCQCLFVNGWLPLHGVFVFYVVDFKTTNYIYRVGAILRFY